MPVSDKTNRHLLRYIQTGTTPSAQLLTKRQRKTNIIIFSIISLFTGGANIVHLILYNPYFLEIEDSQKLIGIISTVATFMAILGFIASDFLNEIIGYKKVIIIAYTLIITSFIFFIFKPERIYWIIIAVLLLSFAYSLNESPSNIILTDTAGEKQKGKISSITATFGRIGEISAAAVISAFAAVLVIFTNMERSYFYIFSAAIFLVCLVLIIFFITNPATLAKKGDMTSKEETKSSDTLEREEQNMEMKTKKGKTPIFIKGFVDAFKDKWVLRVAFTFFFDSLIWSIGSSIHWAGLLDPNLLGSYHLIDENISLLTLITSILVLISMFPAGWLTDKLGAKTLLFLSEICGFAWAIFVVAFVYRPWFSWLLYLSRIGIGLSIGLWIPAAIALFTNVDAKRKSKVYNAIAIFRTVGWMPGGLIAGFLYDAIPQPYGFLTSIFILIAGLFIDIPLFYTLANKPKEKGFESKLPDNNQ